MEATSELTRRRRPIFGVVSILAPLIGNGICLSSYISSLTDNALWFSAEASLGDWMQRMGMILLTMICGWILGLIALVRRERYVWLAYIGLFLSSSPFYYLIYEKLFHHSA